MLGAVYTKGSDAARAFVKEQVRRMLHGEIAAAQKTDEKTSKMVCDLLKIA